MALKDFLNPFAKTATPPPVTIQEAILAGSVIDDPQVRTFCNEVVRPVCDTLASAKRQGNDILNTWDAKNLAKLIPNTADVIVDGSEADGRTPITGADVNMLINILRGLGAELDSNSAAEINLIRKIAVNIR
jgi:hypothetical protein